jgi:hypothetical protein
MRHHEIPSRLLDWTKGSLIALSYATQNPLKGTETIRDPEPSDREPRKQDNAAVWMLEPRRLMEATTACLFETGGIRNIASRDDKVRAMRRDFFKDPSRTWAADSLLNRNLWDNNQYWEYPLPLIPSHISARLESHLSRFTLHSLSSYRDAKPNEVPKQDESLDKFARETFSIDDFWYLVKIEIPASNLMNIARALRMTGVGDMNFTQDLDGLSRELQRRAQLGYEDDKKERPPAF